MITFFDYLIDPSVEESSSNEEVAVTQSLIKMIPMVNKITTDDPQGKLCFFFLHSSLKKNLI